MNLPVPERGKTWMFMLAEFQRFLAFSVGPVAAERWEDFVPLFSVEDLIARGVYMQIPYVIREEVW